MIVPYTLGPMHASVKALEAKAEGIASAPKDSEVKDIIQTWARLNVHRALFAATGAVLGGIAVLYS
jgi:hypothetical protein